MVFRILLEFFQKKKSLVSFGNKYLVEASSDVWKDNLPKLCLGMPPEISLWNEQQISPKIRLYFTEISLWISRGFSKNVFQELLKLKFPRFSAVISEKKI